jgi:hypothetical protein
MFKTIETIKRFFFWGWKLRNNHDWDGAYMYEIIYIKLSRMYDCFLKDGHCMWNDGSDKIGMRRLSECKELARRLREESYHKYVSKHYDKYYPGFDLNRLLNRRNEDRSLAEILEFKAACKKDSTQYKVDKERFDYLFSKYLTSWWD